LTSDDPLLADRRSFFKVELWTKDRHIERLLFAGNSLDKARALSAAYGKRRPGTGAACGGSVAALTAKKKGRLTGGLQDNSGKDVP
jgi:hypothetical protein